MDDSVKIGRLNYLYIGFTKESVDYDMKKVIKTADIMEIADNPQEYFITQEKPVSIVSNLTSSLKKLDSNTEPKKSVTFRHDLITGCHEKSINDNETETVCGGGSTAGSYGDSNCCTSTESSCGGKSSCCAYRNTNSCNHGNSSRSCSPLLDTTTTADVVSYDHEGNCGVVVDEWQLVQADFMDVPLGGDTSIRCVVQPPPDMLATHVCVEVGLVKFPAAAAAAIDPTEPEMPTIVVCNVDVEPCRKPLQLQTAPTPAISEQSDKFSASETVPGELPGNEEDDVLDRISQDLDYLLNRKCAAGGDPTEVGCATPGQTDRSSSRGKKQLLHNNRQQDV